MFLKRNPSSFQKTYGCCMKSEQLFDPLKNINQTNMQKHQQKKLKHSISGHLKFAQRNSASVYTKKNLKRSLQFSVKHVDSGDDRNKNEKKIIPFILSLKQPLQERYIGQSRQYLCFQRMHSQQTADNNRYSNKSYTQIIESHTNKQKVKLHSRQNTNIPQTIMNQHFRSSCQINDNFNYSCKVLGRHQLTDAEKDRPRKELLVPSRQCIQQRIKRISLDQNNQNFIRQYNNLNYQQKNNAQIRFSCKQRIHQPMNSKFQHTIYFNDYVPNKQVHQQVQKKMNPINIATIKQKSLRLSSKKQVVKRQFLNFKGNQKLSVKLGESVRDRNNLITRSCQEKNQQKQTVSNPNITQKTQATPQYNPNIKFSVLVSTQVDMVNSDRNALQSMILINKTSKTYDQSKSNTQCPTQRRRNNFLSRKMTVESINDNDDLPSEQSIVVQREHSDQNYKIDGFLELNKVRSIF